MTFQLKPSESARARPQAYLKRRKLSQPLVERSAGSVFQNPSGLGFSAGELTEKAGLQGFRVGSAKISEIHSNFLINCGGLTSRDMLQLINLVRYKVNQKFGIQLKQEIRYVHPYQKGFNPQANDLPGFRKMYLYSKTVQEPRERKKKSPCFACSEKKF